MNADKSFIDFVFGSPAVSMRKRAYFYRSFISSNVRTELSVMELKIFLSAKIRLDPCSSAYVLIRLDPRSSAYDFTICCLDVFSSAFCNPSGLCRRFSRGGGGQRRLLQSGRVRAPFSCNCRRRSGRVLRFRELRARGSRFRRCVCNPESGTVRQG